MTVPRILVATNQTQGNQPDDYFHTGVGEFVIQCSDHEDRWIGLIGVETRRATTTFKVVEYHSSLLKIAWQIFESERKAGWQISWQDAVNRLMWNRTQAEKYPVGSILGIRGHQVYQRDTINSIDVQLPVAPSDEVEVDGKPLTVDVSEVYRDVWKHLQFRQALPEHLENVYTVKAFVEHFADPFMWSYKGKTLDVMVMDSAISRFLAEWHGISSEVDSRVYSKAERTEEVDPDGDDGEVECGICKKKLKRSEALLANLSDPTILYTCTGDLCVQVSAR